MYGNNTDWITELFSVHATVRNLLQDDVNKPSGWHINARRKGRFRTISRLVHCPSMDIWYSEEGGWGGKLISWIFWSADGQWRPRFAPVHHWSRVKISYVDQFDNVIDVITSYMTSVSHTHKICLLKAMSNRTATSK